MRNTLLKGRKLPPMQMFAKGKTKEIYRFLPPRADMCAVLSCDDLTAQDGKKRASFAGKGNISTSITCRNFEMLRRHGIPVAFVEQWSDDTFIAEFCKMVPIEIVIRYQIGEKSSYLKRFPDAVKSGHVFETPMVEFFLKTTGGKFEAPLGTMIFPCDDPYMELNNGVFQLYYPNRPLDRENMLGGIHRSDLGIGINAFHQLQSIAEYTAKVYRSAWKAVGVDIHDWKGEMGITPHGRVVWADVIDNDSHRAYVGGEDRSKQGFRDDMPMEKLVENYKLIASLAEKLPF